MRGTLIVIAIYLLALIGYIRNIYLLSDCNFDKPFKAEVIRIVGIVVPPVGCITGYMNIDD